MQTPVHHHRACIQSSWGHSDIQMDIQLPSSISQLSLTYSDEMKDTPRGKDLTTQGQDQGKNIYSN